LDTNHISYGSDDRYDSHFGQIHDFGLLNALHNIPSTQESLRQAREALKKYLNQ
jgi:hypothetical protein